MKLLILDKDGSIVTPKTGSEFARHPKDQELLPGVKETIARYHAEGWRIVVASNQGGCALQKGCPFDPPLGSYYAINGEYYKIIARRHPIPLNSEMVFLDFDRPRQNGKWSAAFEPDSQIQFCYKTVEDAIAEFRYLMALLPEIDSCLFCPDFEGRFCYEINNLFNAGNWGRYDRNDMEGFDYSFRKPDPGMIQLATDPVFGEALSVDEILFVGDRAEDEACAKAAGVAFQWAHEFFGGASGY